jgi:5-methylcytosine-specific restriction enzyme subunit McrC
VETGTLHDTDVESLRLDEISVPRRQVFECTEWGDIAIPLEALYVRNRLQLYDGVSGSKYLRIKIQDEGLVFSATHFVGHIPLNDHIALNVVPRFSVSNLTRVLRIARHSPVALERFVRAYVGEREPLPSMFDSLAAVFVEAVEQVVSRGLLTSYARRVSSGSYPQGRILATPTILAFNARGIRHRATYVRFERHTDNAANRLLKYALWLVETRLRAATQRKGIAQLRTRMNRCYRAFSNARLDIARHFLKDRLAFNIEALPTARKYYAQALQLALLLVQDNSLDLTRSSGVVVAPSLLVNLQDAFEGYLRNTLSRRFTESGSIFSIVDGNVASPVGARKGLFDDPASQAATPDIVIRQPSASDPERALAVVEVKYKSRTDREDLNQAIAYGASYRCHTVVLARVNAQKTGGTLSYIGAIGAMKVFEYAFDLSGDLESVEAHFASSIQDVVAVQDSLDAS